MAGPLTLGAAPETLPHSSQFHQSQISFKHKGDGRGFFRLCVDLYPTGFVSYTQHLVCLFSLIGCFPVWRKSASHEENGGHLLIFHHCCLVDHHVHNYRGRPQLEVGLPGLVGMVYWIRDCTCWTSSLVVVPLTVLSVWNSWLAVLLQHQYPLFKSLVFMRGHSGSGSDNGLQ